MLHMMSHKYARKGRRDKTINKIEQEFLSKETGAREALTDRYLNEQYLLSEAGA
jgi:hypothetical protein